MKKTFKGRAIIPGEWTGTCVVSRQGMNTLASFQKGALAGKKTIHCSDQNNPDLYGKALTGVAVCLPKTIGSTTGGMVLQTVAARGVGPAALLFSERIDSLAAGGVILAKVWNDTSVVTVDGLGDEFLRHVRDGMTVRIEPDGTVVAG
ncbi:MAG TPA: DUF126 domain-containing protein [Spirochaetota bacterium]|jgi:hypothetical protein|nr:DUF126 domain-containing protein [Spirochaetota bacterium]OPZ36841.1 MAG: hypothetical protein BWY96_02033 [Spirochaetes bacterium ADurb.BinA120]HPI14107.1 DUF126 domain-containing protein [Spirochaetota bacterium]HPO47105.1 DUF126 domain-containing protein [Spirochaetota bacterium]HPV98315.1 DUF126 domain-containing protein [Spirochaetota bacterium]